MATAEVVTGIIQPRLTIVGEDGGKWECNECGRKTVWHSYAPGEEITSGEKSAVCSNAECDGRLQPPNGAARRVSQAPASALPAESAARKGLPLARGLLDYFPAALAAVAELSRKGNEKHNPGEDIHWARGKSTDHADCIMRHLVDRGTVDPEDGITHSAKVAWRALALLQEELEATAGAPKPRAAR